jgi:hypothetical protein
MKTACDKKVVDKFSWVIPPQLKKIVSLGHLIEQWIELNGQVVSSHLNQQFKGKVSL